MTVRPNILWVCTDQQRADTIAALGNPHIRTPNVDRLVRAGAAFTQAYCQSTVCTPSRASFMTGRYPATTQVFRNDAGPFPASETTAASLFRAAGYATGLIGKLHLSNAKWTERRPDDDGYDEFYRSQSGGRRPEHDGDDFAAWLRAQGVEVGDLRENAAGVLGDGFPAHLHQNHWAGETAIDFVQRHRERPWFLSVHPYDPHHPFDPAPEYHRRYDHESLPHAVFGEHELEYQERFAQVDQQRHIAVSPEGNCRHPSGPNDHPFVAANPVYSVPQPYDSRKVKAAYYAKIEHFDHELGRVLDALEATDQLENTIVVLHSDHGELLGDHGLLYKGSRFYDSLVRIPLIMTWPGHVEAGLRYDQPVELVDVLPTLLDFAALPGPENIQGRSLKEIAIGRSTDRGKTAVICHFHDGLDMTDATHATMSFDGRFKLATYHNHDGLTELFDLANDPDELHNIWDSVDPTLQGRLLRQHLDAMMSTVSAGTPRLTKEDFM